MNNIEEYGNNSCTGCSACAVICPNKAIEIKLNQDGFYSPFILQERCTNCGLCKKVCYKFSDDNELNRNTYSDANVYAAIPKNIEFAKDKSTAGVAYKLAEVALEQGYQVISVVLDIQTNVCKHIIINNKSQLEETKQSKYVQSYSYDAFSDIDLTKKYIVFGTPCQIYGLKKFVTLKNKSDNFIFVDLFCRGVPSKFLYDAYIKYLQDNKQLDKIKTLNLRDKSIGWHKFSVAAIGENGKEYKETVYNDIFYSFFLKNICFNESCYNCKFRHEAIISDIRLGDFWGEKYYSYDYGVNLVVTNSKKGQDFFMRLSNDFVIEENPIDEIYKSQRFNEFPIPEERNDVLTDLRNGLPLDVVHTKHGIDKKSIYKKGVK